MLEKNITIKGIFIAILFITLGFSQASLTIENVDTGAGTLDIYMTNQAGCSYCPVSTYNNNTQNWVEKKELCELQSTWVAYAQITEEECAAVPSLTGTGGWWFDGSIGGYQFFMKGITITEISGGSTDEYLEPPLLNANADCDGDGVEDEGCNLIVAFSISGGYIPAGVNVLLFSVSFTDFVSGVCFAATDKAGEGIESWSGPTLSDASANYIDTDWGDCYCDSAYPADCAGVCGGDSVLSGCDNACNSTAVEDCAGLCGGSAVEDCAGLCGGSAVEDCAGVCGGTATDYNGDVAGCGEMAISQIGSSLPKEFAISQNFPNPFNPVTSITFDVVEMDEVSLVVYDLTGKEVVTLVSGTYTPGTYNVEWNAVNNAGDGIVSGMYIYRYISSEKAITRKMLYLK